MQSYVRRHRAMPRSVLFICTGNYYRSRYAEEYFNYCARNRLPGWTAHSKGLARDMSKTGNVGPMSLHALRALADRGVDPLAATRFPETVQERDFDIHSRIVLLSRSEHEPMMTEQFPNHLDRVEYLEIEDGHLEEPGSALQRLSNAIDDMVALYSSHPESV
jgi:protein-tyrosine phosphatase